MKVKGKILGSIATAAIISSASVAQAGVDGTLRTESQDLMVSEGIINDVTDELAGFCLVSRDCGVSIYF